MDSLIGCRHRKTRSGPAVRDGPARGLRHAFGSGPDHDPYFSESIRIRFRNTYESSITIKRIRSGCGTPQDWNIMQFYFRHILSRIRYCKKCHDATQLRCRHVAVVTRFLLLLLMIETYWTYLIRPGIRKT